MSKQGDVIKFVDEQVASMVRAGYSADAAYVKIAAYCGGDRLILGEVDRLRSAGAARFVAKTATSEHAPG
ncbi:MAG: hypothetical protein RIE56_05135 [Amphiplicatus sp.]